MSEEEANRKLAELLERGRKIAKSLQDDGLDLNQTLTVIFSAAGIAVACSANPMPLDGQILEAARKCYWLGGKTQGVEIG